ncbi:MAG: hypothetical protein ACPG5Z_15990 [Pseudoalteromonas sp.]
MNWRCKLVTEQQTKLLETTRQMLADAMRYNMRTKNRLERYGNKYISLGIFD